jgi:hypothetical protein
MRRKDGFSLPTPGVPKALVDGVSGNILDTDAFTGLGVFDVIAKIPKALCPLNQRLTCCSIIGEVIFFSDQRRNLLHALVDRTVEGI